MNPFEKGFILPKLFKLAAPTAAGGQLKAFGKEFEETFFPKKVPSNYKSRSQPHG